MKILITAIENKKMENWDNEKKLTVLAETRDALCDAFSDAKRRRKSDNFSWSVRIESEKNMALLAEALVKVMDKIDVLEESRTPAQGTRVVKRNPANRR